MFFVMSPLSLDNGWTDRNADCYVNTVDKIVTTATNLVNVAPAISEILWMVSLHGWCVQLGKIRCVLVFKGHSLDGNSIASL